MEKIYHLGLHKTGSTSLQMFLYRNQRRLAQSGILFPPVTAEGWARLSQSAEPEKSEAPQPALNDYMGHNALAYRIIADAVPGFVFPKVHEPMPASAHTLTQIRDEARTRRTRILVMCSEDLARASFMVPATPGLFAHAFGTQDVSLMATIRRPDEAIVAWQSQKLRFGQPFPALHTGPPELWLGSVHFEYRAALAPWLAAFPDARLEIIPYSRQRAEGGAIQAFMRVLGSDCPTNLTTVDNINLGLPYVLVELARQGLARLPSSAALALVHYCQTAASRVSLPTDTDVEPFAPGTRDILARAFDDIHHWLGQITGHIPFFEDAQDIARLRPYPVEDALRHALPALRADAAEHLSNAEARMFLDGM